MKVFEFQGQVALPCSKCRVLTSWKLAGSEHAPAPEGMGLRPVPPKPREDRRDRRQQKRLLLKMQACIRTPLYGDEVVRTENVSKGGFSFKSTCNYGVGMAVEVCLPYSTGSGDIFSNARIAGRRLLPEEGTCVYGVSYIKNPMARP